MARIRFTAGRVAGFKCDEGKSQSFLWSSDVPGLAIRATANGAKSYIFQAKLNSRSLRVTIGDTKSGGSDAAQAEARRLQVMVDNGDDPRQVKAEKEAAAEARKEEARHAEEPALDIWKIYLEARKPKWSTAHYDYHLTVSQAGGEKRTRGRRKGEPDKTQPGPLVPLLNLRLDQLTADTARQWLKDEAVARPTFARLAFSLLRAFLNWCADRPEYRAYVHADACASRLTRDELPKKAAKDDCLQREQLPLWFEHVRKLANPVHSAYLQALLLTGARREELASLKWADVDFQWKSLTIKDKVEGSRTIPLTPFVASLLAALPRRNEWVFSSPTRLLAGHGAAHRAQQSLGCGWFACAFPAWPAPFLWHAGGWGRVSRRDLRAVMGHKPSATAEKHYRRRPLDLLRSWHVKIEAWILEQAGIEQPDVDEKPGLKVGLLIFVTLRYTL